MTGTTRRVSHADTLFYDILDFMIAASIILLTLVFVLYPVLCVIKASFFINGAFTLSLYDNLLSTNRKLLFNSLSVALPSAAISSLLSIAIALTLGFMHKPWSRIFTGVLMLTMISPPLVSSIAYIQLFGKRGLITHGLLKLSINPNGWHGIVSMQSLSFTPFCALLLYGVLSKIDKSLIQASLDLGASPAATIRKVVIPMMKPGIIVCFLLTFVRALSDFGTPMAIGGAFNVLATEIYMRIIAYGELEAAAAMNVVLLLPAILFFILYRKLMSKYDVLSKGNSNKVTSTGHGLQVKGSLMWALTSVTTLFFIIMILQYMTIFISGVTKIKNDRLQLTLDHFHYLRLYDADTFVRSIVYGIIVGIVGTLLGTLLAYYTERRQLPGMMLLDFVATMPYIIPGTFFGIGYILAFNKAPMELTGTAAIVVLNCIFKQLPVTTKAGSAALAQVNVNIEDAARDLGAKRVHVIKDVIFPNMKSAFLVGFINNFTSTMTTIGAIIFLIYPGQKVATLALFDAVNSGEYGVGALIATILILITMTVNLGFARLITRKGA